MTDLYERDPEEIGPEHPDDLNARMNLIEARHWFVSNIPGGRCQEPTRKFCYDHNEIDYHQECGLDSWSILHIDDKLDNHDHGGGDCMCLENDDY